MENTADNHTCIEPELESRVDGTLPHRKLICIDELTREQLNAELQKGIDDIQAGRLHSADEVDAMFQL